MCSGKVLLRKITFCNFPLLWIKSQMMGFENDFNLNYYIKIHIYRNYVQFYTVQRKKYLGPIKHKMQNMDFFFDFRKIVIDQSGTYIITFQINLKIVCLLVFLEFCLSFVVVVIVVIIVIVCLCPHSYLHQLMYRPEIFT